MEDIKLLTADQAREIADKNYDKERCIKIANSIYEAAQKGEYFVRIDGGIPEKFKKTLSDNGYEIIYQYGFDYHEISWYHEILF